MILERLNVFYFMLSFAVGIFVCYITEPSKQLVLKFPSPVNAGKVVYKNKSGECYRYNAEKLDTCPDNAKPQPVLEDFKNMK